MKRLLAGILLLAVAAGATYGYVLTRREHSYRQFIADGDTALSGGNLAAAIEAFSGAIAVKPEAMLGYLKRGETYRRRGDQDNALRDLRRASDLDPTATRPLEELGDVNVALKQYSRAAERYRAFIRVDDRSARVLYKLAFARFNEGRPSDAIESLQKAIALDARFAEAYYLLGLCQRNARQYDAARASLDKAIGLKPTLLHAREALADVDAATGQTEARLVQLEALAALDPAESRDVELGLAYASAGQTDRAVLTLGRAAERYPDGPEAYVALGRVWLDVAQAGHDRVALGKALGALGEAVGSNETSESMTLLGRALLLARDEQSAERTLRRATARPPLDPMAFFYLADAAEKRSHFTEARQALRSYVALRGEEEDPRRRTAEDVRLAELSLKCTDPTAAATYFLNAAVAAGDDASLLARAADAEMRAGDASAARATLEHALMKDPRNAAALALKRRFRL